MLPAVQGCSPHVLHVGNMSCCSFSLQGVAWHFTLFLLTVTLVTSNHLTLTCYHLYFLSTTLNLYITLSSCVHSISDCRQGTVPLYQTPPVHFLLKTLVLLAAQLLMVQSPPAACTYVALCPCINPFFPTSTL